MGTMAPQHSEIGPKFSVNGTKCSKIGSTFSETKCSETKSAHNFRRSGKQTKMLRYPDPIPNPNPNPNPQAKGYNFHDNYPHCPPHGAPQGAPPRAGGRDEGKRVRRWRGRCTGNASMTLRTPPSTKNASAGLAGHWRYTKPLPVSIHSGCSERGRVRGQQKGDTRTEGPLTT